MGTFGGEFWGEIGSGDLEKVKSGSKPVLPMEANLVHGVHG